MYGIDRGGGEMIKERERFEMLLEEMRGNFKVLAEGMDIIRSNVNDLRTNMIDMRNDIKRLDNKIDYVHSSLKQVHSSLKNEINVTYMALNEKIENHVKQPSHAA
jgi:uncharacterized protein YoxC